MSLELGILNLICLLMRLLLLKPYWHFFFFIYWRHPSFKIICTILWMITCFPLWKPPDAFCHVFHYNIQTRPKHCTHIWDGGAQCSLSNPHRIRNHLHSLAGNDLLSTLQKPSLPSTISFNNETNEYQIYYYKYLPDVTFSLFCNLLLT